MLIGMTGRAGDNLRYIHLAALQFLDLCRQALNEIGDLRASRITKLNTQRFTRTVTKSKVI
jgi:hypothetical protein